MHSTLTTQSLVVQLTTQSLVHMYIVFSECPSSSLPTVLHQGHKKQQRDICERESSESVWGGEWSGGAPLAGHGAVWSECERGETRCASSRGGGSLSSFRGCKIFFRAFDIAYRITSILILTLFYRLCQMPERKRTV